MKAKREVPQSIYKNVYHVQTRTRSQLTKNGYWKASITRNGVAILNKHFTTEKEAGRAVDLCLIKRGEEPVNMFKRVTEKDAGAINPKSKII